MRSVFIYEFLTAGGCWSLGDAPPTGSLLAEGTAMRDALAADFAACDFIDDVHFLHDDRLPAPQIRKQIAHDVTSADEERQLIEELAADADYTIVIAPEFAGLLAERAGWVDAAGGRLLSPQTSFIRLTADKHQTAEYLRERDIPAPFGIAFQHTPPALINDGLFPGVLKPQSGAGSTNLFLVKNAADLQQCDLSLEQSWRLEQFKPGIATSISYLAGCGKFELLPACSQQLSSDGKLRYQGGETPLPPALAARANRLGNKVATALPATTGYVGIDIVLGPAENGTEDFAIEVNPRLTTSYLGLRQACQQNLAEAMWRKARGEPIELTFRTDLISFAAGDLASQHPISRSAS
jgi:predicted ATP-grasp superfamily ATP-dependent carboligase